MRLMYHPVIHDVIHWPKVILTAPLCESSLTGLYGLVSFVDKRVFSRRALVLQIVHHKIRRALRRRTRQPPRRLTSICWQTHGKQVTEHIRYANRLSIAEDFTLSRDEQRCLSRLFSGDYTSRVNRNLAAA